MVACAAPTCIWTMWETKYGKLSSQACLAQATHSKIGTNTVRIETYILLFMMAAKKKTVHSFIWICVQDDIFYLIWKGPTLVATEAPERREIVPAVRNSSSSTCSCSRSLDLNWANSEKYETQTCFQVQVRLNVPTSLLSKDREENRTEWIWICWIWMPYY